MKFFLAFIFIDFLRLLPRINLLIIWKKTQHKFNGNLNFKNIVAINAITAIIVKKTRKYTGVSGEINFFLVFIDDFQRCRRNIRLREVSSHSRSPVDMLVNVRDWLAWPMQKEPGERNGWKIKFCQNMSPFMFQNCNKNLWIQSDVSTDIHSTALRRWWSQLWWVFILFWSRAADDVTKTNWSL